MADAWYDFVKKVKELSDNNVIFRDSLWAKPFAVKASSPIEDDYSKYMREEIYPAFTDNFMSFGDNNKRVSNIEIAKMVFKIMKQNNLTKLTQNNYLKSVKDRPGHDKRYALNTSYFNKTIGYKIKFDLSLGLKNTIEWYIKNITWLKSTKKSYNFKSLGLL